MNKGFKLALIGCVVLVGLFCFLIFGAIIFFGVATQSGWMAATEVQSGSKLPKQHHEEISKIINLRPGERILYFYSTAMFVGEDGNLITDQRVVSYQMFEGELEFYSAEYNEIADVQFTKSSGFLEDSTIHIDLKEEDEWFILYVSNENRGDKRFYDSLIENWKKNRDN